MNRMKKLLAVMISVILLSAFMGITASADDLQVSVLDSLVSDGLAVVAEKQNTVSCALDVIAAKSPMAIAGISGSTLMFSRERFECAMNLSSIDSITITALPSISCGSLYIGSEGVSVGQTIKASDISLMTYEEASVGMGKGASFEFTINNGTYAVACNIFMLNSINYSPTVHTASFLSLNQETYKDVMISGVLAAHDPEGDELTFEVTNYPKHGLLVLENKTLGTYTYTPNSSYTGEDSFEYVVRDKYGNYSTSAKIMISVNAQKTSTVYSDMLKNELYSHALAVTEEGLMNGVRVGDYFYFESDREVSRAEFIVTSMNAIGIKNVPDVDDTGFSDDEDISPAMKGYISLAYTKGYISGIKQEGEILLRPNEAITLSEAAVIVSNMIGYAKPDVSPVFADADSIPSWSNAAIESLYTLGILEFPDKTVSASSMIDRGDMAKILNKTMQVIGK